MHLSYFDIDTLDETTIANGVKKLSKYRSEVHELLAEHDNSRPEYSLIYPADQALHDTLEAVKKQTKGVEHLVLVGIGGSSLGIEAVDAALAPGKVKLHVIDTIASAAIDQLLIDLKPVKSAKKLAICIISKSGNTAETLVNGGVLLEALEKKFGKSLYERTFFIGNADTEFMKAGKRLGVTCVAMPSIIGGRYSVGTEVGLVPLAILGHDTDAYIAGMLDALSDEFESVVAENAVRVQHYMSQNFRHYNFFAFEPRLATLGAWYRQLFAESIGKELDKAGKPVTKGMLPTISTPVELHSIGQLYLSGFPGVYTDFVTFDDADSDHKIPKKGIAKAYSKFTMAEVGAALYGGVVGAYQERGLPYRSVIFDESLPYSLGLFMGMRMLETMYIANLMNLNPFDQPNVELYKNKTREILGM